ncbi:MAG: SUMF1/EgtB/PvdO family nonheme iron enzyme [Elusimicrobia bacterium]|nr:SUMF1/EgtB/PvdO family nonheme iron enzyme [Elusimicrobiota bacterium]
MPTRLAICFFCLAIPGLILSPACWPAAVNDQEPSFEPDQPSEGFLPRSSKPEALGIDKAALAKLVRQAQASHSHALIVIKDGRVVVERYFGRPPKPLRLNSVTKSVVSLAIGALIGEGKIAGVHAPLSTWFPQFKEGDKAKITLWNILTHTSGLYHEESAATLYHQRDVVQYALGLLTADEPGKRFSYSNEAVALLPGIVLAAAGKPLDAYLQEKLFGPMGITACDWDRDPAGNVMAYGGLSMAPRDLARIGQLMLDSGRWQGRQLVPGAWVRAATSPARSDIADYGLLWWLRGGGFGGEGWLGQYLQVYPEWRLVAVRMHGQEAGNDMKENQDYGFEDFKKMTLALVQHPQKPKQGLIDWVAIPGGSFMMGADDLPGARPHRVTVPSLQAARTLVTNAQYQACVDAHGCTPPRWGWPVAPDKSNLPVFFVSWSDAAQFSEWAGGRLPSEAEWEYAARGAGQDRRFPWGDEEATCARAVISEGGDGCGKDSAWPVCSKPEGNTRQGLCDMAGDAWEWTQDWYHASYDGAPADGRAWQDPSGSARVIRGGSWCEPGSHARSAVRREGPLTWGSAIGFRPVRERRD